MLKLRAFLFQFGKTFLVFSVLYVFVLFTGLTFSFIGQSHLFNKQEMLGGGTSGHEKFLNVLSSNLKFELNLTPFKILIFQTVHKLNFHF